MMTILICELKISYRYFNIECVCWQKGWVFEFHGPSGHLYSIRKQKSKTIILIIHGVLKLRIKWMHPDNIHSKLTSVASIYKAKLELNYGYRRLYKFAYVRTLFKMKELFVKITKGKISLSV